MWKFSVGPLQKKKKVPWIAKCWAGEKTVLTRVFCCCCLFVFCWERETYHGCQSVLPTPKMVLGALYFCGPRDGTCDGFKVFHKHLQIRQGLGKGFIEWMFSILVSQRAGHVMASKCSTSICRSGRALGKVLLNGCSRFLCPREQDMLSLSKCSTNTCALAKGERTCENLNYLDASSMTTSSLSMPLSRR